MSQNPITANGLAQAINAALKGRFELTLADLQRDTSSATVLTADGWTWLWRASGVANGTTILAAAPERGGVWERRAQQGISEERVAEIEEARPVFSIAAQGTAQAALTAATAAGAYGGVVDLSRGQTVEQIVITDGTVSIQGSGGGGTGANALQGAPTLAGPVFAVIPPADNNAREGTLWQNLQVMATGASNTDAMQIDLSTKVENGVTTRRRLSGAILFNPFLKANNGYALNIMNPADNADGFGVPMFIGGLYDGGLKGRAIGDSPLFLGGRFTGQNEGLDLSLLSDADVGVGVGDSSIATFIGINCTAKKGIVLRSFTRFHITGANVESKDGPGTDQATLSIQGAPGDPVEMGAVTRSFITGNAVKYAVRLGVTNGIVLDELWLAVNGGDPTNARIWITGDSKNAYIGDIWGEGPLLIDDGVGTRGVEKPLTLAAGWVPAPGIEDPTYIKTREYRTRISGAIMPPAGVSSVAAGTVIARTPPAFSPAKTTYIPVQVSNTSGSWVGSVMAEVKGRGGGAEAGEIKLLTEVPSVSMLLFRGEFLSPRV